MHTILQQAELLSSPRASDWKARRKRRGKEKTKSDTRYQSVQGTNTCVVSAAAIRRRTQEHTFEAGVYKSREICLATDHSISMLNVWCENPHNCFFFWLIENV